MNPETLNALASFINTCGLPAACVSALIVLLYLEQRSHKQESAQMTDALNNNTVTMQKLVDKLESIAR